MEIQLIKANDTQEFELPELKRRAKESTKSLKTTHYRAITTNREVAFVSIDRWPELGHMLLYELYVSVGFRQQGVGSALLAFIENTVRNEGYLRLRLRPEPLDREITGQALVDWYAQRGYTWSGECTHEMQKELQKTA